MRTTKRIISLVLAIAIVSCFCLNAAPRKADALTGVGYILLQVLTSMGLSLGVSSAMDSDFRGQLYDALTLSPDDLFAKIQQNMVLTAVGVEALLNFDEIADRMHADSDGNLITDISMQELANAWGGIGNAMPESTEYAVPAITKDSYVGYHSFSFNYVYPGQTQTYSNYIGRWYEYDFSVNSVEDTTQEGMIPAAMFVFVPHAASQNGWRAYARMVVLVEYGSSAYSYMKTVKSGTIESVLTMDGYLNSDEASTCYYEHDVYMPYQTVSIVLNNHSITVNQYPEKYEYGKNVQGYMDGYVASSLLGYDDYVQTDTKDQKAYMIELARKLQAYIDAHPDVANQVISVPVDNEAENDLPGIMALIKALSANSSAATSDLIGILTGLANAAQALTEAQAKTDAKITELTEAVTAIQEAIAGTDVDTTLSNYAYDLSDVFPFCIPFDLFDFLAVLRAEPEAPVIEWPINIPQLGIDEQITLDLEPFNSVAVILRTMELLLFCIGLAFATRDLIRG